MVSRPPSVSAGNRRPPGNRALGWSARTEDTLGAMVAESSEVMSVFTQEDTMPMANDDMKMNK